MKANRIIRDGAEGAAYEGTLSDAHEEAKRLIPRDAVTGDCSIKTTESRKGGMQWEM